MKKSISLFDIIGPVMIGPSSSHTAGAARIGYETFKLLDSHPQKITMRLYNSFTDTGLGHKTHIALLGGALGMQPDDVRIKDAENIAKRRSVDYEIIWKNHSESLHPNTAVVVLRNAEKVVKVVGYSIGGGRIKIAKAITKNADEVEEKEPFELTVDKYKNGAQSHESYPNFSNLKSQSKKNAQKYLGKVLKLESQRSKHSTAELLSEFKKRYQVMKNSVKYGLKNSARSNLGMFGGDGHKLLDSTENILGQHIQKAVSYATIVAEYNARMGKIVAAPTAGSCGIMPGTLIALQEKYDFSDDKMAKSLVIGASLGAVVSNRVSLAGAVAGCQAEIGVAGAMAAGSGVYLLGGDLDQIESGAGLVLGNLLGLICDPVLGLVEVPCILRNSMVTSMVMSAIEMAVNGVEFVIPFDQVASVMTEVGFRLPIEYRETSTGGLAQTPYAKQMQSRCHTCGLCK